MHDARGVDQDAEQVRSGEAQGFLDHCAANPARAALDAAQDYRRASEVVPDAEQAQRGAPVVLDAAQDRCLDCRAVSSQGVFLDEELGRNRDYGPGAARVDRDAVQVHLDAAPGFPDHCASPAEAAFQDAAQAGSEWASPVPRVDFAGPAVSALLIDPWRTCSLKEV